MCKDEVKRYFDRLLDCSIALDIDIDYETVNYWFIFTLDEYGSCVIEVIDGDFRFGSPFGVSFPIEYVDYYFVGHFHKDMFTDDEFELLKVFLDI